MCNGFGTYIKCDKTNINENTIINIGDSCLVFSYNFPKNNIDESFNYDNALFLQIYNNNKKYEPIIISKGNRDYYSIGRGEGNDIIIDDEMLSRIHCCIYLENKKWIIKDGNRNGIKSTNGIWLFAYDNSEITDKMIFKSNSYNFSCEITYI